MKVNPMEVSADNITALLEMYGVDTENDDVQQNITNCAVSIDNGYHGYDSDGNQVGVR